MLKYCFIQVKKREKSEIFYLPDCLNWLMRIISIYLKKQRALMLTIYLP